MQFSYSSSGFLHIELMGTHSTDARTGGRQGGQGAAEQGHLQGRKQVGQGQGRSGEDSAQLGDSHGTVSRLVTK